jgi:predicted tellurium resistance membrane protein TerC
MHAEHTTVLSHRRKLPPHQASRALSAGAVLVTVTGGCALVVLCVLVRLGCVLQSGCWGLTLPALVHLCQGFLCVW